MKRVISGIQPSGNLHLGNYFGAIRQQIAMQDEAECLFFIADYHALTSLKDATALRRFSREVAATYIALGLDPNKAILFRQSDVSQTTELTWLLGCTTGVGQFMRAHAYKDKIEQGLKPNMGLFSYPLLMAADILLYRATHVPVGRDQVQHLEMTCDIAGSFNAAFETDALIKPEVVLSEAPYVPGTDGNKMSKSYGNTIPIFWKSKKQLKKAVNAIVTDSKNPQQEPLDPDTCNAFAIYSLFATPEEREALAKTYREDRTFLGYGVTKQLIMEKMEQFFGGANRRYRELVSRPEGCSDCSWIVDNPPPEMEECCHCGWKPELEKILHKGAIRAKALAMPVLEKCRVAAGLRGNNDF